ncbi:MAG: TolC family protein [Nitrospirae bacterium]|nr:MAG: TolC family protein [Nitrospirota bacterium]
MLNLKPLCTVIFCAFIIAFSPGTSMSGGPSKPKIVLNLQECIKKAVEISPEIGETRYEEDVYKAKKMQADSALYPQIEMLAVSGPSPKARREQLNPIDTTSKTSIGGIFGSAEATLIQPLYTFGKISSYREAAASGIKVAKAGVERKTSEIALRTKELYFGLLLARDLKKLILEIKDGIVSAIEKAEKQIATGSPAADELNLFKLNAFYGEVQRNLNEAEKGIALAKDALATSMGLPLDADFDIADASLTPQDRTADEVSRYIQFSRELRPEFLQIREGLIAKNALVNVEKSNLYPMVFAGMKGAVSAASNRDRINNPYIDDYFNHSYGGAFMGLKWAVDFGITKGRIQESLAEYHKIAEKKRFADEAIPFQVRKSYLDFEEARKNIIETEKGYTNAKKWLVAAMANLDLGIGDAKDMADAALAYAMLKANNLKSMYNHRIAYANLLYASGLDLKELK